jgi:hypothetical protein
VRYSLYLGSPPRYYSSGISMLLKGIYWQKDWTASKAPFYLRTYSLNYCVSTRSPSTILSTITRYGDILLRAPSHRPSHKLPAAVGTDSSRPSVPRAYSLEQGAELLSVSYGISTA